jgi:hypothetical protein
MECFAFPAGSSNSIPKKISALVGAVDEKAGCGFGIQPFQNLNGRPRLHHLGRDTRIDDGHSSKLIGSPTGSSGEFGQIHPPSGREKRV